jgi:hypothetical protein
MAEALKTFREGEDILASETNENNQFLLSKLSDNAAQVQSYVEGEVATIKSNVASVQATLQNNIDTLNTSLNDLLQNIYTKMTPDYNNPIGVSFPFTAPKAGVYTATLGLNSSAVTLYINGKNTGFVARDDATGLAYNSVTVPLAKGDVISWSANANFASNIFYPYRGV